MVVCELRNSVCDFAPVSTLGRGSCQFVVEVDTPDTLFRSSCRSGFHICEATVN